MRPGLADIMTACILRQLDSETLLKDSKSRRSPADLSEARTAVDRRDFESLSNVSESSCLKMHAVMMSARPGLIYWNGSTVECIRRVRQLRADGVPVFFTVDAGPQVKAICLPEAFERVRAELAAVEGVQQVLSSGLGNGARVVER